jgi:hypothetical protein
MSDIKTPPFTLIFTAAGLVSLAMYLEWTIRRLNGHLRQIQKNSDLAPNPSTAGTPGIITSATLFAITIRLFNSVVTATYLLSAAGLVIAVLLILRLG